jgi:hypothetical protein
METWPIYLLTAFATIALFYFAFWFRRMTMEARMARMEKEIRAAAPAQPAHYSDPFCHVLDFAPIKAGHHDTRFAIVQADAYFELQAISCSARVLVMLTDAGSGRRLFSNYMLPSLAVFSTSRICMAGAQIDIDARAIDDVREPFQVVLSGKKTLETAAGRAKPLGIRIPATAAMPAAAAKS